MFKWLKDWLNPTPHKDFVVLDISEPVFSFVNTVKSNPRRFKAFEEENSTFATNYSKNCEVVFKITDKVTSVSFEIKQNKLYSRLGAHIFSDPLLSDNCKFLNKDECNYLILEISKVYQERSDKFKIIKDLRQRKALIKIYGGGVVNERLSF